MRTVGMPDTWRVHLKSGGHVLIMADSHRTTETHHLFNLLIDATKEEQASEFVHVVGTFPTQPERVVVAVAAFPLDEVTDVDAGNWKEVPTE